MKLEIFQSGSLITVKGEKMFLPITCYTSGQAAKHALRAGYSVEEVKAALADFGSPDTFGIVEKMQFLACYN